MTFWGVEIKNRKPYTLSQCSKSQRLRITQATLGFHSGSQSIKENVIVQCKVGDREPIWLCVLIPETAESCPLTLEFEEEQDVILSVIGNRSVHLSGCYVSRSHYYNRNIDTSESYGEDIADTESKQSSDEDYNSDDSFINDGDPGTLTPSPKPKIKTKAEVPIRLTPKFPLKSKKTGNRRRRLIKKHSVAGSQMNEDDKKAKGVVILDSEDEDRVPIRCLLKNKSTSGTSKNPSTN